MPLPTENIITAPALPRMAFRLEPVTNIIQDLVLLATAEEHSGVAEWLWRTFRSMSAQEHQANNLVIIGLHHAITPERSWSSFPAYVSYLAELPPEQLRTKMLDAYRQMSACQLGPEQELGPDDDASILKDENTYLRFLSERFPPEVIDSELERQAYQLIVAPQRMQTVIVDHLNHMWHTYLQPEWERTLPMLESAVQAFREIDYRKMEMGEIFEQITEHELESGYWTEYLEQASQVIFIPNPHIGPYLGKFFIGDAIGVVFGARLPRGARIVAPDLSRNELLVRLSALADDSRLQILRLICERGELRSQEVMDILGLSQSASSRHLKQLSATGYLVERRCEGAKCYRLNPERIEDTLQAIHNYLLAC